MKRFLIWSLSIVGVLVLIWTQGLATAIQRGDIASVEHYFPLQAYHLRPLNGVAVSTVELHVDPQRAQSLTDSIRRYATEKTMVVAVGARSDNDPLIFISVWGGNAFHVSLKNPFEEDRYIVSFFDFDDKEDWRPYRDDFLVFLRATFGNENVRQIK